VTWLYRVGYLLENKLDCSSGPSQLNVLSQSLLNRSVKTMKQEVFIEVSSGMNKNNYIIELKLTRIKNGTLF